jgi:hypothetical protein
LSSSLYGLEQKACIPLGRGKVIVEDAKHLDLVVQLEVVLLTVDLQEAGGNEAEISQQKKKMLLLSFWVA